MAVIWQTRKGGKHYEVRQAGNSLRLYTDGVFHSQYNSQHVLSGSVWDLLALPALLFERPLARVLVLGVGAGAVLQQLEELVAPDFTLGVELDPIHIRVMRRFFGVRRSNVEIVTGDAVAFVKSYRGEPFDLIIDDLFFEQDGEPDRAVAANGVWFAALLKCLRRDGLLVMNFHSSRSFRECAALQQTAIARRFKSILCLTLPGFQNHVAVFSKQTTQGVQLRRALRRRAADDARIALRRLKYRINQVK